MKLKQYIAFLFIIVFLGKFVTIDSRYYGVLLEGSDITIVNKTCPKKAIQKVSPSNFSEATAGYGLEMDFLCHVPVVLEFDEWQWNFKDTNFKEYNYQAPVFFSPLQEKVYPPPKA